MSDSAECIRSRDDGYGSHLSVSVDHHTVRVTGVLDAMTIDLVLGTTSALLSRGVREVTIDLNDTTRIDSSALRELFAAQTDAPPRTVLHLIAPAWPATLPQRQSTQHRKDST